MVDCRSNIIVVGGGVVGVSTFYQLARLGLSPVLLDASDDLAAGTSFANGGLLTPSMPEPWNGPGVSGHLFASFFDAKSPMKVRFWALPMMIPWGLRFLRHSSRRSHQRSMIANFKLAHRSACITRDVVREFGIACDMRTSGTIKTFSSTNAMQEALRNAGSLNQLGLEFDTLSAQEVADMEPELAPIQDRVSGAIYYRGDSVGDARKFTHGLSDIALRFGGSIHKATRVNSIKVRQGAVVGVETAEGLLEATDVIVAAGSASPSLVRPLGVRLHMNPAKGYSITLNMQNWTSKPTIPVIDDEMHAAVTPIGDRMRIAGTAEFVGNNLKLDTRRVDNLHDVFANIYPELASQSDRADSLAWTGLRPMSADGLPYIGSTGPRGLWVNTGHGHLGWTMAMGSAEILVNMLMGETPEVDPAPYRVER